MKHEVIARTSEDRRGERPLFGWRRRRSAWSAPAAAANRLADSCAAIGGVTMLHDLAPDIVTMSFGDRTAVIRDRLHERGWTFVGAGEWKGEPVLGVAFSGDPRANRTTDELAEALITIVGELEVADSRLW